MGYDSFFDNGEDNITIAFTTGVEDVVEFYCYWKLQDALMDCALRNENCDVAFGDTEAQRNMGQWSDDTPVRQLQITPSSSTGIKDADNIQVGIYPNPSMAKWNLTINRVEQGMYCYVYDVLGKCIAKQEVINANTVIESTFGSGVYVYEVLNKIGRASCRERV